MTFFKIPLNCLKRSKNLVWQSADGLVTSDHCRVTVQWLFSKFSLIAWIDKNRLFDSRPTVAWIPTTVAWPFNDFFQNFPKLLGTSKIGCLTFGRRSRDLRLLSCDSSHFPSEFVSYGFAYASVCCLSPSYSYSYYYFYYYSFFPPNSLFTYLLLQEWFNTGNFDIISKLGTRQREFLILAGKFPLVDSLWGKQFPHYKHRRHRLNTVFHIMLNDNEKENIR